VNSIKSTSKKFVVALAVASAVMVCAGGAAPAWSAQAKEAKVEKEKPKGSLSRPFSKLWYAPTLFGVAWALARSCPSQTPWNS